jgi:electron transfer flavoprotein beta subunit
VSTRPLSVAVLLSAGRHPVSGAARACRSDAVALALGRKLAPDRLRVVHAGSVEEPSLQDYLALGAGCIDVLAVPEGKDLVPPLAARLADVDVILTGSRAEQGAGSGLFPYALAGAMGRPVVGNVLDVKFEKDDLVVRQFLPKGKRRGIAVRTPVVLAVHPLASAEFNYAYARRLSGRIEVDQAKSASNVDNLSAWTVSPVPRRPVRLKAQESKAGHARLLSAIVSEAKGGVVAFEGSPVDKAQIMLNYLREHRLIDF